MHLMCGSVAAGAASWPHKVSWLNLITACQLRCCASLVLLLLLAPAGFSTSPSKPAGSGLDAPAAIKYRMSVLFAGSCGQVVL